MPRTLIPYGIDYTGNAPRPIKPGTQLVALSGILPRPGKALRQLRAAHVLSLAESIAALGVLEPLILDTQGRIMAGAHRLAAMQLLAVAKDEERRNTFLAACGYTDDATPKPELQALAQRAAALSHRDFAGRYPSGKIPVHAIAVPHNETTSLPLAIEAAENSVRRQFTTDEIQALAVRLKEAGYTARDGRPKKGEKTVVAALEAIIGKSTTQVRRLLKPTTRTARPSWDRAMESFARAALRMQREGETVEQDAEAKALLNAAKVILGTTTGRRMAERRGTKT